MQHASLLDDWLGEAVQEAVEKAVEKAKQLDDAEEHALRAFTFAKFNGYLESLPPQHTNGSSR